MTSPSTARRSSTSYNLWVENINKTGRLFFGHKVTLKVLNDNSDPATAATNSTS